MLFLFILFYRNKNISYLHLAFFSLLLLLRIFCAFSIPIATSLLFFKSVSDHIQVQLSKDIQPLLTTIVYKINSLVQFFTNEKIIHNTCTKKLSNFLNVNDTHYIFSHTFSKLIPLETRICYNILIKFHADYVYD